MSRRSKAVVFAVVLIAILVAVATLLLVWWNRPPEAARLLPDSEAVIYVNLRPLRLASVFKSLPPVSRDPDYQAFVDATGFQFERDLDEAAIAVHLPQPLQQSKTGTPQETRYSEVFVGSFNLPRLTAYFQKSAKSTENYAGKEIFAIPVEQRTVRVALLSDHLAVVSNNEDPNVIHGMMDRARAASLARGPELVRTHYREVPLGSLGWALAQTQKNLPLPNGLEIPMPSNTTWVCSIRYAGSVQIEAQALTQSDNDAQQITESLGTLLTLFHSIQANTQPKGADPDAKAFFDSLRVNQDKNRAIVTADVPVGFLKKIANGATTQ